MVSRGWSAQGSTNGSAPPQHLRIPSSPHARILGIDNMNREKHINPSTILISFPQSLSPTNKHLKNTTQTMLNRLKKFRGEDSEYIEGLSPLPPPPPPEKEKEKKSLFQRIQQHSSKRHDEQTTSLDGFAFTSTPKSTSTSTSLFPPPEIPAEEIKAEQNNKNKEKKKEKKKSLYQRFEETKRGEIKPEDVLKYTGKNKKELDAWAKTEAYVAGNQPATGVVGGVWGRVQNVEMRFPPSKK